MPDWLLTAANLSWSLGLALAVLIVLYVPLERAWLARAQPILRPAWRTDLGFLLGQYLLWNIAVTSALVAMAPWLRLPGGICTAVAAWPWWIQATLVIVLSDLAIYWGHRAQHRVAWLWRFHRTHHTAEHLDWLAAHREHPIDTVYTMGLINLPALMLGFPLWTIVGFATFRGLWAILIHSNTRLPLGPLACLIGAPETHRWHHHRDRDAGNYANLSPLWDIAFGTYHRPAHEDFPLGTDGPRHQGYVAHLLWPLRWRRSEP